MKPTAANLSPDRAAVRLSSGPRRQLHERLKVIESRIPRCARCPELRAYGAKVARAKRAQFRDWNYWGRPVPGFGDPRAKIMIVGLAPAAHGANRTGRMFTGDRSGDFLYAALHRVGLASQPTAVHRDDGLTLKNVFIAAALRCAPPGNRPTPRQVDACRPWLVAELGNIRPRIVLCLGAIAWDAALHGLAALQLDIPRPRPRFAHGKSMAIDGVELLGCYHVSQQNTFTGRLTAEMLDSVLATAKHLARVE
jgi:uracil-DNA glycosylase family 4